LFVYGEDYTKNIICHMKVSEINAVKSTMIMP